MAGEFSVRDENRSYYSFNLRSGEGSYKMLCGPYTPEEAAAFGRREASGQAMRTGHPWMCDYYPVRISRADSKRRFLRNTAIALIGFLIGVFAGVGATWL